MEFREATRALSNTQKHLCLLKKHLCISYPSLRALFSLPLFCDGGPQVPSHKCAFM
jgi:hypothetical protein